MRLQDVQAGVETAAQAIAELPADQWGGWVIYLLEALQDKGTVKEYTEFLETLQGEIGGWHESARW